MSFVLMIGLQIATASDAETARFDLGVVNRHVHDTPCGGAGDEIVVCGPRRERFRLPLPNEREAPADNLPGRADMASGTAAIRPPGPCGLFAGQRRCGKREAAAYGYGGGRDPVTVFTKLAKRIADPDADITP